MIVNDIDLELKFNLATVIPNDFEVIDLYGKPSGEVSIHDFSSGYELTYRSPTVREYLSIPWDAEMSINSKTGTVSLVGSAGPHGYGSASTELPQESIDKDIRVNFRAQPIMLLTHLLNDSSATLEKLHEFANEIEFDYSMNWLFKSFMSCNVQFINNTNK